MKFFVVLLFSTYMIMATLAAPLLHFGNEQIRVHDSSENASMNTESRSMDSFGFNMNDTISRCLRAAAFFTTAVPSSLVAMAILAAIVLLCGIVLRFGAATYNLIGRWKFPEKRHAYFSLILYLAIRLFRKWLALLELSPNFIAASSG